MSYPIKINAEIGDLDRDDQKLLSPSSWVRPMIAPANYPNGDLTPSPGIYYTNLKTPEGSLFRRYVFQKKKCCNFTS